MQRHIFLTVRPRDTLPLVPALAHLRRALCATRAVLPLRVDAWVILPDHMHVVCALGCDDADVEVYRQRFLHDLAATAGGGIGAAMRRAEVLHRPLRGMIDYADSVRRCWFDPVRHDLVRRPEDWAPSSIHLEVRRERVRLVA